MEKFTFDLAISKKLHSEQEPDNAVDKFAMKVVKKERNSWPFCTLSHTVQRYGWK